MFAQEPDLEFIRSQDIADRKIIGSVIANGRSTPGQGPALPDDDLVSIQQANELQVWFLSEHLVNMPLVEAVDSAAQTRKSA